MYSWSDQKPLVLAIQRIILEAQGFIYTEIKTLAAQKFSLPSIPMWLNEKQLKIYEKICLHQRFKAAMNSPEALDFNLKITLEEHIQALTH